MKNKRKSFYTAFCFCLLFSLPFSSFAQERTVIQKENKPMQISIQTNNQTIVYTLNDSPAAKQFYTRLPLSTKVENYSTNEKIFYPAGKLDTTKTPLANGQKGTLAYYSPWGNIVLFYDSFGQSNNLYELGHAVSGQDQIENLSGIIEVKRVE